MNGLSIGTLCADTRQKFVRTITFSSASLSADIALDWSAIVSQMCLNGADSRFSRPGLCVDGGRIGCPLESGDSRILLWSSLWQARCVVGPLIRLK